MMSKSDRMFVALGEFGQIIIFQIMVNLKNKLEQSQAKNEQIKELGIKEVMNI